MPEVTTDINTILQWVQTAPWAVVIFFVWKYAPGLVKTYNQSVVNHAADIEQKKRITEALETVAKALEDTKIFQQAVLDKFREAGDELTIPIK